MTAPNPLAARRRTNSISLSAAVPSSWDASVVSGAIPNRFAISCPQLNRKGDQTTINQTSAFQSCPVTPNASVEDAARVDDDGLAGHRLRATHGDHHVGAVGPVGWPPSERARCGTFDLFGPEIGCRARAVEQTRCHAIDER